MITADIVRVSGDMDTPDDFVCAVAATLSYWLAMHTDAECWASGYIEAFSGTHILDYPKLEWMGCEFDLADAVVLRYCKRYVNDYSQCSVCGIVYEYGGGDACECQEEYDNWQEEHEDDEEEEGDAPEEPTAEDVTVKQLYAYFEEVYCSSTYVWNTSFVQDIADESLIETTLIKDAFPAYRNCVSNGSDVDTIIEEVQDALRQLRGASNRAHILEIATWAAHLRHVNGDIMRDYADNVYADSSILDSIQQKGLVAFFPQEDIDRWIAVDDSIDNLDDILDSIDHLLDMVDIT